MASPKSPSKPTSTLSKAASRFLLGSSSSVRRASFWRTQDENQAVATPQDGTGHANPSAPGVSPWWLQDDLWEAENEEAYDLPAYPPPNYTDNRNAKMDLVVTPDAAAATGTDDISVTTLMARPPTLNRSLTAVSLKAQDDFEVSYKGRGRGRRRGMAKLRKSNSVGTMNSLSGGVASVAPTNVPAQYMKPPSIHKVSVPYFTIIVTVLDIILMVWEFIEGNGFASPKQNPMLGPNGFVLLTMGGKWVPSILHAGEWWRFWTSCFLHAGLVHIGLNLASQTKVLWDLEKVHGTLRIVPIYLLSGVGGMVLSAVFLPNQVTVGASGAIFGLDSVLLVDLIKNWSLVKKPRRKLLMIFGSLLFSFALGLFPGVDNFAHFGGLVVGLLAAFIFLPSMHIGRWSMGKRLLQVCIALPLLLAYFIGFLSAFYHGLNGNSFCSWCHYIACLPVWSSCNGG